MNSSLFLLGLICILLTFFATVASSQRVIPIVRRFQYNKQRTEFEPLKPSQSIHFGESGTKLISLPLPLELHPSSRWKDEVHNEHLEDLGELEDLEDLEDNAAIKNNKEVPREDLHSGNRPEIRWSSLSTPLKVQFRIDNLHLTPWIVLVDPYSKTEHRGINIDIFGHRKNHILHIITHSDDSMQESYESSKMNNEGESFVDRNDVAKTTIDINISYNWKHVSKDLASDIAVGFLYVIIIILSLFFILMQVSRRLGRQRFHLDSRLRNLRRE